MRKEAIVTMRNVPQGQRQFRHYYEIYQADGEPHGQCYGWALTHLFPRAKSGTRFKVTVEIVRERKS